MWAPGVAVWDGRTIWNGPLAGAHRERASGGGRGGSSSEVVGEVREDGALGLGADDALDRLAALEDRHGRDRHDLVVAGDLRVLVDVQLGDRQLLAVLGRDLLQ